MAFPNYPNPGAPRDPLAPSATKPVPRFTREELQILKQCNRESFFGRCVPLMAALGLGAYYGVHLGYLKKNPKYGATLKVGFGLLVGFIGGKVSYLHKCEEKFLSLPGGRVKESILMKRSGKDGFLPKFDDGVYNDASLSYAMPYVGSNLESGEAKSIFELDTDRPYDSFDDSFRGKSELDNENESLPQTPPSRSVTYDELRQQNRAEYESRRKMYRSGPIDDYAPYGSSFAPPPLTSRDDERFTKIQSSTSPSPPPPPPSSAPLTPDRSTYTIPSRLPPPRKNLYGDVMEK